MNEANKNTHEFLRLKNKKLAKRYTYRDIIIVKDFVRLYISEIDSNYFNFFFF